MAASKSDFTNYKFGKLTAIKIIGKKERKYVWECLCECGGITSLRSTQIKQKSTLSCGCLSKKYHKDISGKEINNLKIIDYIGINKYNNRIYNVICFCEKRFVADYSDLIKNKVRSCGCLKYKKSSENSKLNWLDTLKLVLFKDYKNKALYRGYNFELSFVKFIDLIENPCYYCGTKFSNKRIKKYNLFSGIYRYNGIDRVNNKEGYTENNVVSCCSVCNQAKHKLDKDFFLNWVEKVSSFQKEKNEKTIKNL